MTCSHSKESSVKAQTLFSRKNNVRSIANNDSLNSTLKSDYTSPGVIRVGSAVKSDIIYCWFSYQCNLL